MKTKLNIDLSGNTSEEILTHKVVTSQDGKVTTEPIVYIGNIVSAKEEISKSGNAMLVLTINILDEAYNTVLSVNDYFPYKNKLKILRMMNAFKIKSRELYVEDFLNLYIKVTLKKEEVPTKEVDPVTGEIFKITQYRIDRYVGLAEEGIINEITRKFPF